MSQPRTPHDEPSRVHRRDEHSAAAAVRHRLPATAAGANLPVTRNLITECARPAPERHLRAKASLRHCLKKAVFGPYLLCRAFPRTFRPGRAGTARWCRVDRSETARRTYSRTFTTACVTVRKRLVLDLTSVVDAFPVREPWPGLHVGGFPVDRRRANPPNHVAFGLAADNATLRCPLMTDPGGCRTRAPAQPCRFPGRSRLPAAPPNP